LRPYEILATSPGCGIIEFLPDTLSIDYIRRKMIERGSTGSLLEFYSANFGPQSSKGFIKA
jgi:hypothetical protein